MTSRINVAEMHLARALSRFRTCFSSRSIAFDRYRESCHRWLGWSLKRSLQFRHPFLGLSMKVVEPGYPGGRRPNIRYLCIGVRVHRFAMNHGSRNNILSRLASEDRGRIA